MTWDQLCKAPSSSLYFVKEAAWDQQTVIVNKTHAKDRDEAKAIARGFSKRMYTSRETSTSYRFRQKNPGKFVPGSFRTKKIPGKGVSIVYGELNESHKKTAELSFSKRFEKNSESTPLAKDLGMNYKIDQASDNTSLIPPGSSWAPSGMQQGTTSTNIRRVQDTHPSQNTDIPQQGGLVPPVSFYDKNFSERKYATAFKSDYAPESFAYIPPTATFNPPGTVPDQPDRRPVGSPQKDSGLVPPISYNSKYGSEYQYGSKVMNKFYEGFEKKAFSGDDLAFSGLVGAGVGSLFGGEKVPGKSGKENRSIGALRGGSLLAGAELGEQLLSKHQAGLLGNIVGGIGGYMAAKHFGPKYQSEKK